MRYLSEFGRFLSDTWRSRWLLFELTKNDFRGRYLGSALGIVWAIVQPVITLMIMWFIFAVIYPSPPRSDKPFVLWLMAGMIPWYFISESIAGGANSIVEKSFLVSKVTFRVSILPIVKISSALVIHLFFFAIMLALLLAYGFTPDRYYLQIPYFLIATILLLLGVSWITSAMTVFFRDVTYMVSVALQFLFWLTPIFWSPKDLAERGHPIMMKFLKLNPLQYIIEGYRGCVIDQRWFWEPTKSMIYFWVFTTVVFVGGAVIFRRLRHTSETCSNMYVYAKISQIEEWMLNGVWKAGWYDQYGWEYPWSYQTILKYAKPGNRLLDVGAGTCQIADKIHTDGPNLEVHVVNSKHAFETIGVFRPKLIYHEGLLGLEHDLQPETFDIIYSVSVLEHIHEGGGDDGLMNALQDMKRLLKPGGYMIHAVNIVLDPDVYPRWRGFAIENFIRPLNMQILPEYLDKPPSRRAMLLDPDLFVVSPQTTHELRWCGKNVGLPYFRVTGVGIILRKTGG